MVHSFGLSKTGSRSGRWQGRGGHDWGFDLRRQPGLLPHPERVGKGGSKVAFATRETDVTVIIRRWHLLKVKIGNLRLPACVRARSFVNVGTIAPRLESTQRLIITERFAGPIVFTHPDRSGHPRYINLGNDPDENRRWRRIHRRRRGSQRARHHWPVKKGCKHG